MPWTWRCLRRRCRRREGSPWKLGGACVARGESSPFFRMSPQISRKPKKSRGKQSILCPAETEHPFHPRHHALESTGLASNTETDSPRPRDAACLSMSQVLSRVCRKLCRKFVASSLLQAKPIEQVIGCPLCNEQTAVCHPPQIPLQRTSADPRKKCLELADLDGGKL